MDKTAGKPQLLLHPAGKISREAVPERPQPAEFIQAHGPPFYFFQGYIIKPAEEINILLDCEILIQSEPLRHIGKALLHPENIRKNILSPYGNASRLRFKNCGHHSEKSTFAGAVGAHDAEDFPFHHIKVQR